VVGMKMQAFLNAGYSMDYSNYVIESAFVHITNSYKFGVVHYEANGEES
jgi:xanthine dehydrogenase molybdopterin-binding subunit B